MIAIHNFAGASCAMLPQPGVAIVSIVPCPSGGGNVGDGLYNYSCSPKSIPLAYEKNQTRTVTFQLDGATQGLGFSLLGLTSTSAASVTVAQHSAALIEVSIVPDKGQLIIVALVVQAPASKGGQPGPILFCDPQVDNSPKT